MYQSLVPGKTYKKYVHEINMYNRLFNRIVVLCLKILLVRNIVIIIMVIIIIIIIRYRTNSTTKTMVIVTVIGKTAECGLSN